MVVRAVGHSRGVPPSVRVLLLEERAGSAYLVPSGPLGRWARKPLTEILDAIEPGTRLTLDLARAPVSEPLHVAAILFVAGEAARHDVALAVEVPDMVSAELLAFSGIEAAVQVSAPEAQPPAPAKAAESSGY
jgi:hypothetical protein